MPHLARLQMLAREHDGMPFPPSAVREIADAANAVVAEAEAAGHALLAALGDGHGLAGNQPLLAARLTRLKRAAHEAVASAQDGDASALRQRLRRFDAMTSAIWIVDLSVCE